MKRLLVAAAALAAAAFLITPVSRLLVERTFDVRGGSRPSNVLLITLDTTRADRLGSYGYAAAATPVLDALAREGARFADATAAAPITGPSHAAMFTGLYPGRHAVRDNVATPLPDDAVTLAEVLSAAGYETAGFIGAFVLDRPYGFAQGFATFDSGFTRVESGTEANTQRRGDAVVDDALAWLEQVPTERPFFAWVHLYDPHAPYDGGYDAEIALVDREVGRLLERLRARGLYDDTLINVIADHGEGLGEHAEDEHGVFLYDSVLRVPWIVRGPGVKAGTMIEAQARGVDLFPTLLEAAGASVPEGLDGVSVWPLIGGATRVDVPASYAESYYPKLHWGWSELRAIRADGYKAIDAPRPELYNLRDDPGELHNLYASQQALADRMIAEATRLDREMRGGAEVVVAEPDRETMERLRSLGYVGAMASGPAGGSGERGPDPKDRIGERRASREALTRAIDDLRAERFDAAAKTLRALIAGNERSADLHELMGDAYRGLGRLDDALGEYGYAALINASAASPRLSMAEIHIERGNLRAARTALDEATALAPQSFDVAFVTGRVLESEGRVDEALAAYQRAIALNPANPRPRRQLATLASRIGRLDIAEREFRAMIAMGYQPSRASVALGGIAQIRGNRDEAIAHYREALRLEPGLPMAMEALRRLGAR